MEYLYTPFYQEIMLRFTIISLFILIVLFTYWKLRVKAVKHFPRNYPHKHLHPFTRVSRQTIVTCIGDSITHGNMGVSFIELLEKWFGSSWFFFNAGVNARLTYTVLDHLDEIIATQPAYITLLIGTNDINASLSETTLRTYWDIGRIPKDTRPSFETFKANYTRIVERLTQETIADIALISLPVMGEDLTSKANERADQYSTFIKNLARTRGLTYLPVRERMKAFLERNPKPIRHGFQKTESLMKVNMVRHHLLGQSWDKIAMLNGHDLVHDNLHLTTRGAAIVATEMEAFLKNKVRVGASALSSKVTRTFG